MKTSARAKAKRGRSRGRPRPEDAAAIESRLVAVALKEFLEHGYGGTSMTQIVRAAGVSKTTLYSRFASKAELFRAIIYDQIEGLSASASLQFADGVPNLERGLKAYANHILALSLQGDLLGVNRLMYSESHRFPELGAAAAERSALGARQISRFIRRCAEYDGVPCNDPDGVAEAFIFMIRGWFINVMVTNRAVTAAERERWVDRTVHALLAPREQW